MAEASEPIEVELKVAESNTQRQLNLSISATVAIALVFLMLAMYLAPSASKAAERETAGATEWWNTPLSERHTMDLPMDTMGLNCPRTAPSKHCPTRNTSWRSNCLQANRTPGSRRGAHARGACGCRRARRHQDSRHHDHPSVLRFWRRRCGWRRLLTEHRARRRRWQMGVRHVRALTATHSPKLPPSGRVSPPTVRTSRGWASKPAFKRLLTGLASRNGQTETSV